MKTFKTYFFFYFKSLFFIFLSLFCVFFGWFFKDIFFSYKNFNKTNYLTKKVNLANSKIIDYLSNNKQLEKQINNINKNIFPYYYLSNNFAIKTFFWLFHDRLVNNNHKEFSKHFVINEIQYYFDFNGVWNFSELKDIFAENKELINIFLKIIESKVPQEFKSLITYDNLKKVLDYLSKKFSGNYYLNYSKNNNLFNDFKNLFHNNFIYQTDYNNNNLNFHVNDFFNFFPNDITLFNNNKEINLNLLLKTFFPLFFSYNFSVINEKIKIDYNSIVINYCFGKV